MRLALALLLVAACGGGGTGSPDNLGAQVWAATEDAWYARGDLQPIGERGRECGQLDQLEIHAPRTQEAYLRLCRRQSSACLFWALVPGRVRSTLVPVAVMSPTLPASRWVAHGIHEILHAARDCAGLGPDYDHLDARVWETGGPDSVESLAERTLYDPNPPPL